MTESARLILHCDPTIFMPCEIFTYRRLDVCQSTRFLLYYHHYTDLDAIGLWSSDAQLEQQGSLMRRMTVLESTCSGWSGCV